jgi:hypothetical protein
MHPLALLLFVLFAGRDMQPANIEEGAHAGPSPKLMLAGGGVTLIGVTGALWAYLHWDQIIVAASNSTATAAGIFVASAGSALVGLFLIYAGLGRQRSAA